MYHPVEASALCGCHCQPLAVVHTCVSRSRIRHFTQWLWGVWNKYTERHREDNIYSFWFTVEQDFSSQSVHKTSESSSAYSHSHMHMRATLHSLSVCRYILKVCNSRDKSIT